MSVLVPIGLVALGAGLVLAGVVASALTWWVLNNWRDSQQDAISRAQVTARAEAREGQRALIAEARAEGRAEVLNQRTEDEKRGKPHWGAVDVAEIGIDDGNKLAEDLQVVTARLENSLLRMEWLRQGGSPNANWNEIVTWKNKKEGAK